MFGYIFQSNKIEYFSISISRYYKVKRDVHCSNYINEINCKKFCIDPFDQITYFASNYFNIDFDFRKVFIKSFKNNFILSF